MFAVIKTGGKQYKVAQNDEITIAKLDLEPGASVVFDHVTMVSGENGVQVGAPRIDGFSVTGEVLEQTRGAKVIAFKKRRRQNSKRKRGHRQDYTVVRITAIGSQAAAPTKKKAAKAETADTAVSES